MNSSIRERDFLYGSPSAAPEIQSIFLITTYKEFPFTNRVYLYFSSNMNNPVKVNITSPEDSGYLLNQVNINCLPI
jgi:hypothetical protein